MRELTILRHPERDSTLGPLKMVINRTSIERYDENKCCEIKRVVDKALIEKPDCINKDADPDHHQPQQKIPIPDAAYHSLTSWPTA
jgi:hypothetical protein